MAVPHRLPAVSRKARGDGAEAQASAGPEAQRTGLVIRPKNGNLGRSARLPASPVSLNERLWSASILPGTFGTTNMKNVVETPVCSRLFQNGLKEYKYLSFNIKFTDPAN